MFTNIENALSKCIINGPSKYKHDFAVKRQRDSTETEKIALYFTKLHSKHSY